MKFIFIMLIVFLLLLCIPCKKYDELSASIPEVYFFDKASECFTDYIEMNKIITFKSHTYISYLSKEDDKYIIPLIDMYNNVIVDDVLVGSVTDNHGGATIQLDNSGFIHIVYGGHIEKMKYIKSKTVNEISSFTDPIFIEGNNNNIDWTTYPSFVFDDNNTLHLCYRAENKNYNIRNPSLRYCRIFNNDKIDYQTLKPSSYYYANYTASVEVSGANVYILYREFSIARDKSQTDKGVYLLRSNDFGNNFETETENIIRTSDSSENIYISNLTLVSDEIVKFVVFDYKKPLDYLKIFSVGPSTIESYDLYSNDEFKSYFLSNSIYRSPYIGIEYSLGVDYIVLATTVDNYWKSDSNRILYFKCVKNDFNKIIYDGMEDVAMSWLPITDKKSKDGTIPSIMFTSLNICKYINYN